MDPLEDALARAAAFRAEAAIHDSAANRVSLGRLIAFVVALVLGIAGVTQDSLVLLATAGVSVVLFAALVILHVRIHARRDAAEVRQQIHDRHAQRMSVGWMNFPATGSEAVAADHPYAFDIDLVGPGSLFQRIDTTRTVLGERTLLQWLGNRSGRATILARQAAVAELSSAIELRQELEAAGRMVSGDAKLDGAPFLQFTKQPSFFEKARALVPIIHVLPWLTVALLASWSMGLLPPWPWLLLAVIQIGIIMWSGRYVADTFDLIAARRGYVEAFYRMLELVERSRFESPLLQAIQKRVAFEDKPPSVHLRRLDRWAGFADLRTQFLLHLPLNTLLLWDLHVLLRLERWNRDVGRRVDVFFEAIGELEALATLGCFAHIEPDATFPDVADENAAFVAEALAHPLLPRATRIPNDVALRGPSTALIVTGSNMAGKSTLLRAVGLNIALGASGAPVCTRAMTLPDVRLRASMRAEDSLQRGASYFHAELTKLRTVVADADGQPPVFFLLDELLRGTNARARHLGARAVVQHLLARNATGLVATHDVALSALEREQPGHITNAHFTDVVSGGEMTFDYRLRPGVVRTSNALRLLRLAGIDVPNDDTLPLEENV